ncbi:MAG: PIN domain-containing protein [Pseudohongiellaceae bacterium]
MSRHIAIIDANVLYSAPIRDVLIQIAVAGLFDVRWTEDIHKEWIENLLRKRPDLKRASIERTHDEMNDAIPNCLVSGYKQIIPTLVLPDPDDYHVLAAAITARCDVIVTQNLKDFPQTALSPHGIDAQHPDDFLHKHLQLFQKEFCAGLHKARNRLKNPSYSTEQYLENLKQHGLVKTVAKLEQLL